jgi:hypothetical protein
VSGNITSNPNFNMAEYILNSSYSNESTHSYSRLYASLSQMSLADYTPEVSYYAYKAGLDEIFPSVNFKNILANMDEDHLYN